MGLAQALHPDDRGETEQRWKEALSTGGSYEAEYRIRRADGAYHWFIGRGRPQFDDQGQVVRWFGTCTDIEDRKQSEEALRDQTEFLQVTLRSIGDAVVVTDDKGVVSFLNPVARELCGWDDSALGEPLETVFRIVNEQTRDAAENPVDKVLREGRIVGLANHTVLVARDGTERPIDDSAAPILDGSGAIRGAVLVFRDVSDQKAAERALREANDRLNLAVEAGNIGTWDLNPVTNELSWSDRTRAAFGLSPGAPIDFERNIRGIHPDDRERVLEVIRRLLSPENGGHYAVDFRTIGLEDGVERRVEARGRAFFDREGVARRFIGTVVDITERKRTERALAERNRLAEFEANVGLVLTELGELPEILRGCCEAMVRHLDAAFARIWTLDESGTMLELASSAGCYTHLDGPHARVPLGRFKIGRIAKTREPHLTNEVQSDPRVGDRDWARREGMVAFAGYPLEIEGRLLGVMALFARRPLSSETLGSMATAAKGVSLGIERKRIEVERAVLLEREQEARKIAEASRNEAEAAGQAKDRFLAMLSHELRTPINPVLLTRLGHAQRPIHPRGDAAHLADDPRQPRPRSPADRRPARRHAGRPGQDDLRLGGRRRPPSGREDPGDRPERRPRQAARPGRPPGGVADVRPGRPGPAHASLLEPAPERNQVHR